MNKQWLFSKRLDLYFMYLPILVTWILCFIFDHQFETVKIPLFVWVVFVLGVDVSHVWSTIFRTYLSKDERSNYSSPMKWAPIIAFILSFFISWYSEYLFWRVLAYFALFHFIKQQYGFIKLYEIRDGVKKFLLKDTWMIYLGTLYPVLIWHLKGDRKFNWFVQDDFFVFSMLNDQQVQVLNILYFSLLSAWVIEQVYQSKKVKQMIPIGKILWMVSTFGTWWLGIVYFNSDFSFTITNVVAHGIPYMLLVFYYVEEKKKLESPLRKVSKIALNVIWMISICLLLGYFEEFFWDIFINSEKKSFYGGWTSLYLENDLSRALCIGLLSLPQITHYILDGIIWKGNKNKNMRKIFAN